MEQLWSIDISTGIIRQWHRNSSLIHALEGEVKANWVAVMWLWLNIFSIVPTGSLCSQTYCSYPLSSSAFQPALSLSDWHVRSFIHSFLLHSFLHPFKNVWWDLTAPWTDVKIAYTVRMKVIIILKKKNKILGCLWVFVGSKNSTFQSWWQEHSGSGITL